MTFAMTFKRGDRVALRSDQRRRGVFLRLGRVIRTAVIEWDNGGMAEAPYGELVHAPVDVLGARPAAAPTACPACGNVLSLDPEAIKVTPRPGRRPSKKAVRVAACGFCEYIVEVPK